MNDYGRGGGILGASILPATSALGVLWMERMPSFMIIAFLVMSAVYVVVLAGFISRYLINKRNQ